MARHGGPSTAPPQRDWTICRWFQFTCVIRSPSACKSSRSGRVTRGLGYLLHVCTRIARHRSTRASIRTRGKEVGRKSQSHTTWKHRRAERDPPPPDTVPHTPTPTLKSPPQQQQRGHVCINERLYYCCFSSQQVPHHTAIIAHLDTGNHKQ